MSIFPLSSPISAFGLGGISPLGTSLGQTSSATRVSFASSSTVVQISETGHLLSSISNFQNRLDALRPGTSSGGIGTNFGTDFASLAAETQHFVDAFNSLQDELSPSAGGLFGLLPGSSLTTRVTDSLNERLGLTFNNGNSALTQLRDLGIELQPSPLSGTGPRAGIDLAALRSAFDEDPDGAFSLLSQAAESFSALASDFTGPRDAGSLTRNLLQASVTQQSLSLLEGLGDLQNGQQAQTDLLTLAALGSGNTSSQGQLLAAMSQFSLISSLLE